MIVPDFRDNARQRAGDDPADARGIGIQRSRRARLARHQILKIEHTDTGEDPDVNRVQRLHRQQQGRGMDSQHTDIKQQSGKPANGRSLMKVVALGVKKGHRLRFTAQGEDAQQALDAIGEAIAAGLGEGA